MKIKTPQGLLKAEIVHDEVYPGIKITLDGITVAVVEHTDTKGIQTCAYTSDDDEEPTIIKYFKEGDSSC